MMKWIGFVVLTMLNGWWSLYGQVVIWQEDFNNYQDGTVAGDNRNQGNPAQDWISGGCMACIDTADWWEIRSGSMEARDVNQVVFMQSEVIDISGFKDVEFSLDVDESGDHEGLYFGLDACADQDKEDYVNVLFRVDGGPWALVSNSLGWCGLYSSCGSHTLYGDDGINSGDCRDHDDDWGNATVKATGLSGNSLEIRIETINSATDEIIRFDNLVVKGVMVLPVVLKTFNVTTRKGSILLHWQTASETNNDYFAIERSALTPNGNWETIGQVTGIGASDELSGYFYEDRNPYPGKYYYRLKQVDFDGNFEYSEIKSIVAASVSDIYPNPATDYVIIPIDNSQQISASIAIYNSAAAEIYVNKTNNNQYIQLDLSTIPPGYYIITLGDVKYRLLVIK